MFRVSIVLKNGLRHTAQIREMKDLDAELRRIGYAMTMVRTVNFEGV